MLTRQPTLALPQLMDPSCGIYFPKEERVLALYPETTTFYGANIVTSAKRRKTNDYMVLFDEVRRARALSLLPQPRHTHAHTHTRIHLCAREGGRIDARRCALQETDKKNVEYMYVLQYPQ